MKLFGLKNIISSIDEQAFVSLIDVHEVLGEGFTLDEQKRPIKSIIKIFIYKKGLSRLYWDRPFFVQQSWQLVSVCEN